MRAENVNEEFARYTAQLKPNKTVLDLYNEILKDLQNERKGESKKKQQHCKMNFLPSKNVSIALRINIWTET